MPTKYKDISKGPSDLLSDDYTTSVTLKCKKNAGPIAVTIETDRSSGGALSSKIGGKFSYGGVSFDKVQLKADGGHVLETSLVPYPGFKLSFKGNKGADLGIDYSEDKLAITSVLDVKDMSKFSASSCYSLPSGVVLGGDASYSISKSSLSGYNLGASYSSGNMFGSITTASKFSQANLGLLYKVNKDITLASKTTHAADKPFGQFSVGCSYNAAFGTLKAKVVEGGVVSASVVTDVAEKVTLTASGTMTATDPSTFKYGFGLSM